MPKSSGALWSYRKNKIDFKCSGRGGHLKETVENSEQGFWYNSFSKNWAENNLKEMPNSEIKELKTEQPQKKLPFMV